MATVDDLAYELLSAIFSEFLLPFDFDDIAASREARRTLVSASLVSTRWRDPAQRALFERPLFTDRAKSPVSQWLRGEARKRYLVTRIDFASARYGFESDEVDKVLRSTERLEEVRFGMIVNGEPWKLLTLPAVAGLRYLTLAKVDWWTFPDDASLPPIGLTSLNLTLRRDPPSEPLLLALFTSIAPTLTHLTLDLFNEPGSPGAGNDLGRALDLILPLVGPTLHSLSLKVHYRIWGLQHLFAHLLALGSLTIDFLHELDDREELPTCLVAVPGSVRSLVLGWAHRGVREPLDDSIVAEEVGVAVGALGRLMAPPVAATTDVVSGSGVLALEGGTPRVPCGANLREVRFLGIPKALGELVLGKEPAFFAGCARKGVEVIFEWKPVRAG